MKRNRATQNVSIHLSVFPKNAIKGLTDFRVYNRNGRVRIRAIKYDARLVPRPSPWLTSLVHSDK